VFDLDRDRGVRCPTARDATIIGGPRLKRPSTHDGLLQLVKRGQLAIHRRRALRLARQAHCDQSRRHFLSQVCDGSLPGSLDPGVLGARHRHTHDLHGRLDANLPGAQRLRHAWQLFEP
jgi:hypothetical protein